MVFPECLPVQRSVSRARPARFANAPRKRDAHVGRARAVDAGVDDLPRVALEKRGLQRFPGRVLPNGERGPSEHLWFRQDRAAHLAQDKGDDVDGDDGGDDDDD